MAKHIVFFIGAGFTKAVAPGAPNGREFFEKGFFLHNSLSTNDRIVKLKEFIDSVFYRLSDGKILPRIEDVLSLLDYCIQQRQGLNQKYDYEELIRMRHRVVFLMGKLIQQSIEGSANLQLAGEFVERVKNCGYDVTLVTTNYDILLDDALFRKASSQNYGIRLRRRIGLETPVGQRPHEDMRILPMEGIPLLKLHGSLNWLWCPKCDEIDVTVGEKGVVQIIEERVGRACINDYCTSNYEPLLITPTMLKVYEGRLLGGLLRLFHQAVEKATALVFIGYSFPDADYLVRSVLMRAMARNPKSSDVPVVVVDYKDDPNTKDSEYLVQLKARYASIFGNRVSLKTFGLRGLVENFDQTIP